ncbi:MAG: LamG-like jellyroll fold domain-containing protein [Planctomycetota bacterium]
MTIRFLLIALLAATPALAQNVKPKPDPKPETPNLIHERHTHQHNPDLPTVKPTPDRFFTTRQSDIVLPLPEEQDAFVFAVFGDRTGGPDEGVNILADAVRDVNLIEPDLVMTVGDMIQGYNRTPEWMVEMTEYKAIMDELISPWFPVAGNHDIYWQRGETPPEGYHEKSYEMHFGPLWYSFKHKNSSFIVLYSDEGDPETGEKRTSGDGQKISKDQLAFLRAALDRAKDDEHVFIFLHHPRWTAGRYGNDWNDKVHPMLVEAGNVTAVFAGHIHQMRYDPKDGIEYVTLATTGGGQNGTVPDAGWLHHYHVVTVRKNQVAMAAFPVGEVLDVREITAELHEQAGNLAATPALPAGKISPNADGSVETIVSVEIANPTDYPIDYTLTPESRDDRWSFFPDHAHGTVAAGKTTAVRMKLTRAAGPVDATFDTVRTVLDRDLLAPGYRYQIPPTEGAIDVSLENIVLPTDLPNGYLALDGERDAVAVESDLATTPDGPFTVEGWVRVRGYGNRVGLLAKSQGSEHAMFISGGRPDFAVHLGGDYRRVGPASEPLPLDTWAHVAGVYTGRALLLFIDGKLVDRIEVAPGMEPRSNDFPFYIGADPAGGGRPTSFFNGDIDEVRMSRGARYTEDFTPRRRLRSDADTIFYYPMDLLLGPIVPDAGPTDTSGRTVGAPRLISNRN